MPKKPQKFTSNENYKKALKELLDDCKRKYEYEYEDFYRRKLKDLTNESFAKSIGIDPNLVPEICGAGKTNAYFGRVIVDEETDMIDCEPDKTIVRMPTKTYVTDDVIDKLYAIMQELNNDFLTLQDCYQLVFAETAYIR